MRNRCSANAVVGVMLLSAAAAVQVWAAGGESEASQPAVRAVAPTTVGEANGNVAREVDAVDGEVWFNDEFLPLLQRLAPS